MIAHIYSNQTVSVTDLKKNLATVLAQAREEPIAVLNHNRPEAYIISAEQYKSMLERLEELEDIALAQERTEGPFEKVRLEDL